MANNRSKVITGEVRGDVAAGSRGKQLLDLIRWQPLGFARAPPEGEHPRLLGDQRLRPFAARERQMQAEPDQQQRGTSMHGFGPHDSTAPGGAAAGHHRIQGTVEHIAGYSAHRRIGAVQVGMAARHRMIAVERQRCWA